MEAVVHQAIGVHQKMGSPQIGVGK
jgi:hypothetical protein